MKIFRNIRPSFKDHRGSITNLVDSEVAIKSILIIKSKKGAIRANHYHKKDSHYCYMLSGKMSYSEKDLLGRKKKRRAIIKKGDMVYSPPGTIHKMKFLKESVFLAFATESRLQPTYEKDTVRIPI